MKVSEQGTQLTIKEIVTTIYEKNQNPIGEITLKEVIEEIKSLLLKLER